MFEKKIGVWQPYSGFYGENFYPDLKERLAQIF